MKEYMIYGSLENDRPNIEIFFVGELTEAKEVYKKLIRLSDLAYPETDQLRKEQEDLISNLKTMHSVNVFGEDDPVDFDVNIAEFTKLRDIEINLEVN